MSSYERDGSQKPRKQASWETSIYRITPVDKCPTKQPDNTGNTTPTNGSENFERHFLLLSISDSLSCISQRCSTISSVVGEPEPSLDFIGLPSVLLVTGIGCSCPAIPPSPFPPPSPKKNSFHGSILFFFLRD